MTLPRCSAGSRAGFRRAALASWRCRRSACARARAHGRAARGFARLRRISAKLPAPDADAAELAYETCDWQPAEGGRLTEAIYEPYSLQSIHIPGAQPHPTAARAVGRDGRGRAAEALLPAASAGADGQGRHAVRRPARKRHLCRRGACRSSRRRLDGGRDLRHGLGRARRRGERGPLPPRLVPRRRHRCGKGRQVAGILLDNWLKGRRKALWISKSDKLMEDAQRDWSALGQERLLITPLSRFRQGTPIRLAEGILFTTYATLRSQEREGKRSRIAQIIDWVGRDFDGVIVFDEAHAMANAAGGKGERGDQAASQQGKAGLRLQHALPDARVVYVSATGATAVENLAYAQRLGIWGSEDFPFATRPSSSRRSRRAASPRWKCSPATSSRSASMPPARCPMTASNTR